MNKVVANATCDPLAHLSVKTGWVQTSGGGSTSKRGMGKMSCSASLPAGGATNVKVKLAFASKPASLTLRRADLVLKQ